MHESHCPNGNQAMKQDYKIFAYKLTELRAIVKKLLLEQTRKNRSNWRKT